LKKLKDLYPTIIKIIILLFIFNKVNGLRTTQDIIFSDFIFADDSRQQISPLLFNAQNLEKDYIMNYHKNVVLAPGIKFIYGLSKLNKNKKLISKIIPYIIFILFLISIYLCANLLHDNKLAFNSVIFSILSSTFITSMYGGLNRSFSYFFVALGLYFLLRSKLYYLGILTIVSSLFYPTAALISGTSLFFLVIFKYYTQSEKFDKKNIILVLFVLIICSIILLPSLQNGNHYGARISQENYNLYPEAGKGGRYGSHSTLPYLTFPQQVFKTNIGFLKNIKSIFPNISLANFSTFLIPRLFSWTLIFIIPIYVFLNVFFKKNKLYINILIFLFSVTFLYHCALVFEPFLYFPQRFIHYTAPIIYVLLIPIILRDILNYSLLLVNKWSLSLNALNNITLMLSLFLGILLGREPNHFQGLLSLEVGQDIYEHINKLPENIVVAGWPNEITDNVSYLCSRSSYITYETHQVFHEEYLLEMRRRFKLFLLAYFSNNINDIKNLRDNEGVTHLIINKNHFKFDSVPKYFIPFNKLISLVTNKNKNNYFLEKYIKSHGKMFGNFALIDLVKL
jgi:hypothetical protein